MKSKLDDLPSSDDKDFWLDAEVHKIEPHSQTDEGGHFLIRVAGNQAQCTKCHWGFYLDPGDEIRDGHLYNGKKLVI